MKATLLGGNTRRQLIMLALPLLIGNILQLLYNTVDSMIVSNMLGTNAFSAVGVAGSVMNLFIFVLNGFCTGISVIFSQMYGRGDRAGFRREVFISVVLGAGITLTLSALFMALLNPLLRWINSPEILIPDISAYLTVIICGMIATFFYNLFSGILRAIGDTAAATWFLVIAVVMNAVLDYVFIGFLHFGVSGAAWATVISQVFSAVCCLTYLLKKDRELMCTAKDARFEGTLVKKTLSFGFSTALHQSSLYIGKIFVQGAVNSIGMAGVAAYTATMRIEGFANSFGTSYGQAASVFISQNWGGGRRDRVREGFRKGIGMAVMVGAVLSVAMAVIGVPALRIFLKAEETQAILYGTQYMRWISVFYILCFTGNVFMGYFRGIGKVYVPLCLTTMHIGIRACLSYAWAPSMGLKAIAIATGCGWICMTIAQVIIRIIISRREGA